MVPDMILHGEDVDIRRRGKKPSRRRWVSGFPRGTGARVDVPDGRLWTDCRLALPTINTTRVSQLQQKNGPEPGFEPGTSRNQDLDNPKRESYH